MHRSTVLPCATIILLFSVLAYIGSLFGGSFFYPRYFFYIQVPFLTLVLLGLEVFPLWLKRTAAAMLIVTLA